MALALNTGHALYGNLKAFVCVDSDNTIKDLVNTGVTFTPDGAVTIGTGTFGKHFRTISNGYDPTLVTFTGAPSITGSGDISIILVFNQISGQSGGNPGVIVGGTHGTAFQQGGGGVKWGRWDTVAGSVTYTTESAGTLANGTHTLCMSRVGSASHSFFKDGASVSTGTALGNETTSGYFGPFGGEAGLSSVGADFVYAIMFNKALSLAEYQEIHNNLGSGNASSLLAGGSTPVAFSGTVANQTATVGVPFSLDLASYFGGSLTPFTYSTQAGSLGSGLSRTGSVISGTPSGAATLSGLQIRATDTGSNTADTNAFSITISTSDTTPPTITGPSGATGSTSSVSVAENTTAVHTFTANETVTWDISGGADASLFGINSSTGALAFLAAPDYEAPADSGTNNTYVVIVRATDTATPTANTATQTVTVTVTDVSDTTGSFTTDPMENNTRSGVLASQAVVYTYTEAGRIGSMSGKTVHDGSGTTSVGGTLTVSGLPLGVGMVQIAVLGATPADDQVFHQPVTVA
jgi:hypothetical protein